MHLLSRRAKIAELSSRVQRQESTLRTLNLPDGGVQLRAHISQQRRLLAELIAKGGGEVFQFLIPARCQLWQAEGAWCSGLF